MSFYTSIAHSLPSDRIRGFDMNELRSSGKLPDRGRWAESYELGSRAMKEAGRWVLGVVAGLLLAATNVGGFGSLEPDSWRFWLAVGSAVVTLISVGRIVFVFLEIQVNNEMAWDELTQEDFRTIHDDYRYLLDYESFQQARED